MAKKRFLKWVAAAIGLVVLVVVVVVGLKILLKPKPGTVLDEAMEAGLTVKDLTGSTDDYLREMDRGWDKAKVHKELAKALNIDRSSLSKLLSEDAVWNSYNRGRNNWVVWTAGNDRLWDFLANNTFGAIDFLKTLSSHPSIRYCGNKNAEYGYAGEGYGEYAKDNYARYTKDQTPPQYPPGYLAYDYENDECSGEDRQFYEVSRENRWKHLGLVNEPCFNQATGPDPERFGLWLDKRIEGPGCPPDPFEDEEKYPGVKIGARGEKILGRDFPVGSYYGYGTGIVGLRLFPNPDFDEEAAKKWDPVKFYNDPTYYERKDLVRPYRVGMSCGFCHVGPSPINPPADPENPEWKNLTSNPGAQYFWIDRIFVWNPKERHKSFIYQLFHTSLPGTLDTSLVSSDNINNPRTMNAVYSIAARLNVAKRAKEMLTGGELNNKQFNDYKETELLSEFFKPPDTVFTPHVLKDGADSVGILGALNRVYINIGLFSEEWLLHFRPLLGNVPGKRITPIEIAVAEKNSTYWNANVAQTPDLALFFLVSAQPDYLKDAPRGKAFLTKDEAKLRHGKIVFAENCARCHSGKQPKNLCELGTECKPGEIIENSASYFAWMRREVNKPDFLENNFLSTERRIPVTELGTNACSPLATNGLRGDIWDNFTSTTYKELPAVGKVTVHHPKTGEPWEYEMPGGGRGYTRPASLISLWSTAPFLLNNSVGNFYGEATLDARLASFDDSIRKMLWPERRRKDSVLGDKIPGYIQRTTSKSYLNVPGGYLPGGLRVLMNPLNRWFPGLFGEGGIKIGPIPKGTPVSLLASLPLVSDSTRLKDRKAHVKKLLSFLKKAIKDLKALPENATDDQAREVFGNLIDPLVALSKCPDYVVNRGHYFGSNLEEKDKLALIEFLKTF